MILITNSRIPKLLSIFISIRAITLYPFIIFEDEPDPEILNHEKIHIQQQKEMLVIFFYILYVWYWVGNRLWHKKNNVQAYYNIPFEREAYENDSNMEYLDRRPIFSWRFYCD